VQKFEAKVDGGGSPRVTWKLPEGSLGFIDPNEGWYFAPESAGAAAKDSIIATVNGKDSAPASVTLVPAKDDRYICAQPPGQLGAQTKLILKGAKTDPSKPIAWKLESDGLAVGTIVYPGNEGIYTPPKPAMAGRTVTVIATYNGQKFERTYPLARENPQPAATGGLLVFGLPVITWVLIVAVLLLLGVVAVLARLLFAGRSAAVPPARESDAGNVGAATKPAEGTPNPGDVQQPAAPEKQPSPAGQADVIAATEEPLAAVVARIDCNIAAHLTSVKETAVGLSNVQQTLEGIGDALKRLPSAEIIAAAVIAAIAERQRKQKEAEAERIRQQKGAELQRIEGSDVVTLARELESSARVVSLAVTGRIAELVKYQELLEATREARNALAGEDPSGVDVEALKLRWEELKGATNLGRFLPLVEALGEGAGRLLDLLGLVEIKPPENLSASELADYEVAETSGAGDRFRLVKVSQRGYRNREGKVLSKPKISVYATGA
jgi:hypothetical protein